MAGTEKGVTEPTATFSTCFGGPFMPRHPSEYGKLLGELIDKYNVNCWLVSTGWTGGAHGVGHRMPIKATRALLNAALDGSLNQADFREDETFGFMVPTALEGVDPDHSQSTRHVGATRPLMTPRLRSSPRCLSRISRSMKRMSAMT